ncbi:MAG TPA: YihY/virulence factor BrkB family protein [Conexibacter sp.]|nr:YihY/virulence factor BrkB family protein [Conexibacter sp.]
MAKPDRTHRADSDPDVDAARRARADLEAHDPHEGDAHARERQAPAGEAPAGAQPSGDAPARRRMDYRPVGTDTRTSLFPTLKRTVQEFNEDGMTDWAAALTYYGLLALFPALIALVSVIGLVGDPQETTRKLTDIVTAVGPSTAADTFSGPIESITSNRGAAGILFVVGLAVALWSASGYIGAFSRAANIVYETPEGRPFWKLRPLQMLIALVMVILLAALALALVLTGPIVDEVAGPLGVGDTATTIWDIAKWPVMLAVVVLMIGVLFHATPNVKLPGFKWVTPGAVLAIVVWLVASAAFAFYVANFGSYDKTYGALGGMVVLLMWLWITNIALLLGMELNAERERNRELEAGVPGAERELQLDARDEPNRKRTT